VRAVSRYNAGGDEKLQICSTGDVDTVPLGVSPRGQDAFAGETHGDKLYGRGTSDMKSGVAAMTVMALRLAKISHRRAGMMLIFTAGEEITCVDAYAEIAKAWCGV